MNLLKDDMSKFIVHIVVISILRERGKVTIMPQFLIARGSLIRGHFADNSWHEYHYIMALKAWRWQSRTVENADAEKQIVNEIELPMILVLKFSGWWRL